MVFLNFNYNKGIVHENTYNNTFQCLCFPMYTGKNCEYTCPHFCGNGRCWLDEQNNDPYCRCYLGYFGPDCIENKTAKIVSIIAIVLIVIAIFIAIIIGIFYLSRRLIDLHEI
ncbi:hypothetical protein MXB_5351 [Myxobolus squamalis]|nr:hypothetical protein MXB_5351 [Myxobolus squamalis]